MTPRPTCCGHEMRQRVTVQMWVCLGCGRELSWSRWVNPHPIVLPSEVNRPIPIAGEWSAECLEAFRRYFGALMRERAHDVFQHGRVFARPPDPLASHVAEDQVEGLVALAREGNEAAFKEIARCLGVAEAELDEMWRGTVKRVGRDAAV